MGAARVRSRCCGCSEGSCYVVIKVVVGSGCAPVVRFLSGVKW